MALVRQGRTGKSIADHPIAPFQSRTDQPFDVLSSIRCVEQQFRRWRRCLLRPGVQQKLAHRSPQRRPPRFPGADQVSAIRHQSTARQPAQQMIELGGLTAAINPVENDEATAHATRNSRALSTTVIELMAISRAARGGDSSTPWLGSRAPAARGRTIRL